MLIIILQLLFFVNKNFKKVPKNPDISPSNIDQINKIKNSIGKTIGKEISDGKTLEVISALARTLSDNHRAIAIGHIMATATQFGKDSLVHKGKDSLELIHHNDNSKGNLVTIQKTHAYIGGEYSKKIRSFLSGPLHTEYKKNLTDSLMDYIDEKYRPDLKGYAGVNQRGFLFLGSSTFLTLKDIEHLCDIEEEKVKKFTDTFTDGIKEGIKEGLRETVTKGETASQFKLSVEETAELMANKSFSRIGKKLLSNSKELQQQSRKKAAILGTKTKLKIVNRLPIYDTHVIIHLAYLKDTSKKVGTVQKLLDYILSLDKHDDDKFVERTPEDEILNVKNSKEIDFGTQVITPLNTNLLKTEAFEKQCGIAKSWKRKLPSNGLWEFNLRERYVDGIDLNNILANLACGQPKEMPVSFFFIIEYFGDRRGSITRIKDKETIGGVYTPCLLNFDFKLEMTHLSKSDPKKVDEIMSFYQIKKKDEFEDQTLAEDFYPTRKGNFNVNYEDVKIFAQEGRGKSKVKTFKLDLDSSIVESEQNSLFEKLMRQAENIDLDASLNFTPDDLPFRNSTNSTESTNLRGKEKEDDKSHDEI